MGNTTNAKLVNMVQQHVDLTKYVGTDDNKMKWYNIESNPSFFENGLHDSYALYSTSRYGRVLITNVGTKSNGEEVTARGVARAYGESTSIFNVRFSPFQPGYPNYYIIDASTDQQLQSDRLESQERDRYDYALVTNSSGGYIWILSSTRTIPRDVMNRYMNILHSAGVNTSRLTYRQHIMS